MNKKIRKKSTPSIGIAFGGGAARGFVHIGVLEALSDAGDERLMPQLIAGTSTGSIMGALYASGLSIEAIKTASEKIGWSRQSPSLMVVILLLSGFCIGIVFAFEIFDLRF